MAVMFVCPVNEPHWPSSKCVDMSEGNGGHPGPPTVLAILATAQPSRRFFEGDQS